MTRTKTVKFIACCFAALALSVRATAAQTANNAGLTFKWNSGHRVLIEPLLRALQGHAGAVGGAAFSPDGKYILSADARGVIKLWDTATGRWLRDFTGHSGAVAAVAFSPDGRLALSAGHDGTLRTWDVSSGKCLKTVPGAYGAVSAVFSADGRYALLGANDTARIFDLASAESPRGLDNAGSAAVALSADGAYALASSDGNAFGLWNARGRRLRIFEGHNAPVSALALSPDGKYAASGGADRFIKLWDAQTASCLRTFVGHAGRVASVAFSPDGTQLLSSSADGTVKLWDAKTGRCLHTFPTGGGAAYGAAFSPDGRLLLSSGADRAVRVWEKSLTLGFLVQASVRERNPAPPLPPPLEQGRYESRAAFDARVEKAKSGYEAAVAAHNKLVQSGPSENDLALAFGEYYGAPMLFSTHYDADTAVFTFAVVSDGDLPESERRSYAFALENTVPNSQAEAFEEDLKTAAPHVYLALRDGVITPLRAEVEVEGRTYTALPSGGADDSARQVVDLSGMDGDIVAPGQVDIAVASGGESPELAAKAAELAKLRRDKAEKEKIAAMEAEIASLKGTGGASYSSDVDKPSFTRAERPDDYALVIGIESYKGDLPKADYAERDADAVKAHLLAMGVPERNIKLLKGSDATNATFKNYLESWLPRNVNENSRVYFYFSGHGSPDTKTGGAYILPWDGDPEFLDTSAYPLEQVYASLGNLKSKSVLVALDSCFSGAGGHSVLAKGTRPLVMTRETGSLPDNVTLISAATGEEITGALDEQGHGIFTYYFLKGLDAGISDTGKLCGYITPRVNDAAARANRSQKPVCRGAVFGW